MFEPLLLCEDRLSGWVIARPSRKRGLTAQNASHLIMDNGWETFGLPAIITSDQGPYFVGQWWRKMCARLGIRRRFSQAYRPQAKGRTEITGKSLIGLMRKVCVEDHINWVEELPYILRVYRDAPGESGVSSFELVFGRERILAGTPTDLDRNCEDARQFCDRVESLVTKTLQKLQAAQMA